MRQDRIVVQPYDPRWAETFREQRAVLDRVLAAWLVGPVEHIGSTSVPGLPAKPIVDMLARVDDASRFAPALDALRHVGWVHAPEPGDADGRRWSACFPTVEHRTHHLHVVERRSTGWPDWLLFRDYLRAHPGAAARYADLKRRLATTDDHDRARYRAGKAPLIQELMDAARTWDHRVG